MLMANQGNIGQVRDALRDRNFQTGDIVDYDGASPINAEMVPGIAPAWYLVEVVPGQERIAAAHLAGRRFGIFIPDMRHKPKAAFDVATNRWKVERGDKLDRLQRMFVGYIFVFTWLDDKNLKRIQAIPGVRRLVCWPGEERIVKISDRQIDELRALEAILCPVVIPEEWRKEARKRYGWRKTKRIGVLAEEAEPQKTFMAIKGWINIGDQWIDTIDVLRVLDGRDENQSLARALGLASQ